MLIPNHPADERLAAFADSDADAAEFALATHVASCVRCTAVVDQLAGLRAALAELPDLAPDRPLRLLPPVDAEPGGDRAAGWVRRIFAPLLVAGAAVALVGAVGTTAPILGGMASGGASGSSLTPMLESSGAGAPADGGSAEQMQPGASDQRGVAESSEPDAYVAGEEPGTDFLGNSGTDEGTRVLGDAAERSPWPMVLFAGIALIIGALLLRWILVPRAG